MISPAHSPTAEQTLFDVRFYPFPTVDNEQIFAAVGEREVFVWRVKPGGDPPFELLRWFHDEDVSGRCRARTDETLMLIDPP